MNNKITTEIQKAVQDLRSGGLVAFPTETVYGLGADARNPAAIAKVFKAKGRPADHPLIVHIATVTELSDWAIEIPDSAYKLAASFWPGPLTFILKKHPQVSNLITGGQDTIALRIPQHTQTLELLCQFGSGLVGPSANKYGHVSPTTPEHVAADLYTEVTAILDGGACAVGIESTIINLLTTPPQIMRQGAITAAQISKVLQQDVAINTAIQDTVRTAGSDASHYAPNTPVVVLDIVSLITKIYEIQKQNLTCSVISMHVKPNNIDSTIHWQTVNDEPVSYAHDLYANLRAHDQLHNNTILIEQVPNSTAWGAIKDRLTRASFKA